MMTTNGSWGEGPNGERSQPHIRYAGVALNGSLVVKGAMRYPADDNGHFANPDSDLLRISRVWGMRIARCRASRDPSGFLRTEEYGAQLHVPDALETVIHRAFCRGAKGPIDVHIWNQDGHLLDSTSMNQKFSQPLTRWALHIDDDQGTIAVTLSATLHATHIEGGGTSRSNHWKEGERAKLEVSFSVDPVTRIACFGSYIPAFDKKKAIAPALIPSPSSLSALHIEDATVGTYAELALSGDRWIYFYADSLFRSLSITEHDPPTRTAEGFLEDSRGYRWPRVTIRGIDMDFIASAIARTGRMRLVLRDGLVGELRMHGGHGSPEDCSVGIIGVDLTVELAETGLLFTYEVETVDDKKKSGSFRLPWELVILRYPRLIETKLSLNHRLGI